MITNTSWNVWNFRTELIDTLLTHGFLVSVMAPEDKYSARLIEKGYHFIPLKRLQRKRMNPAVDMLFLAELRRNLTGHNIDFVISYTIKPNIYGAIAAWLVGIPAVCTLTGLGYSFGGNRLLEQAVRILYRFSLAKASHVVFQNPDDAALFRAKSLVTGHKISVIPGSGINLDIFHPMPGSHQAGIHFLYVGRMLRDKGIIEFCEAALTMTNRHDNVHFTIVGSEDEGNPAILTSQQRTVLNRFREKHQVCSNIEDVRPYLASCDVYVMPSYREGLPKSTLEAMAMAKPVITTDVPGCRETVRHQWNGWLVAPQSSQVLIDAMEEALKAGKEKLAEMGQNSLVSVQEKFGSKKVVETYLLLIKRELSDVTPIGLQNSWAGSSVVTNTNKK